MCSQKSLTRVPSVSAITRLARITILLRALSSCLLLTLRRLHDIFKDDVQFLKDDCLQQGT